MTYEEFKAQVEDVENKSCYMCKSYCFYDGYSSLCKKCEELTGGLLKVNIENKCGFFEKRLTPKEVIEKFNVRMLKEKQDTNCRVCKKSETEEITNGGTWIGICDMTRKMGAFIYETGENCVCDCFEQREDNN